MARMPKCLATDSPERPPSLPQVISIPDDDDKSPAEEKKAEEPTETSTATNGEADGVKDGDKSPEVQGDSASPSEVKSEAKSEAAESKSQDSVSKGLQLHFGISENAP